MDNLQEKLRSANLRATANDAALKNEMDDLRTAPLPALHDSRNECCMAWLADAPLAQGAEKAVLIKNCKWPEGSAITVSFLDGDPAVWRKVAAVAQQWVAPGMANLSFQFLMDSRNTDIRISFRYAGSWSVIGTTCRHITDTAQPTMNFGWLNTASSDEEIRRVVLHEFGHALGLTHEHLSPAGGIPWDRAAVIRDLSGSPNNWPVEKIETNMFNVPAAGDTNFTAVDKDSIMMYPIPARWTNNQYVVGLNSDLSQTDKDFIKGQYP